MSTEVLYLQTGETSARQDRWLTDRIFSEGVSDPGAGQLLVTQRAGGANMSVDVAPGDAIIAGDSITDQGKYQVRLTAGVNVPIDAAPAAGTRVDLVVLRVHDSTADGGDPTLDGAAVEVVTGEVDAGAPAVPATALPLATVTVAAGAGSVFNTDLEDQRTQLNYTTLHVGTQAEQRTQAEIDAMAGDELFNGRILVNATSGWMQYLVAGEWVKLNMTGRTTPVVATRPNVGKPAAGGTAVVGANMTYCAADGRVYRLGGSTGTAQSLTATRDFYRYDPALNTWTALPAYPATSLNALYAFCAASKTHRKIIAGGDNQVPGTAYWFDIDANEWGAVLNLPSGTTVHRFRATQLEDGRIWLYGGYNGTDNYGYSMIADPVSETVTYKGNQGTGTLPYGYLLWAQDPEDPDLLWGLGEYHSTNRSGYHYSYRLSTNTFSQEPVHAELPVNTMSSAYDARQLQLPGTTVVLASTGSSLYWFDVKAGRGGLITNQLHQVIEDGDAAMAWVPDPGYLLTHGETRGSYQNYTAYNYTDAVVLPILPAAERDRVFLTPVPLIGMTVPAGVEYPVPTMGVLNATGGTFEVVLSEIGEA